jgi:DNA polymerase V
VKNRIYAAIDLKSFYASVECVERGLDPLKTMLCVADESRTEKTITLAVTPPLKALGISGRSRLYEVIQKTKKANIKDYIIAPPRMEKYIEYSNKIFNIYLKYVSIEDIHVYSIDEVFMDITDYLNTAKLSDIEFVRNIIAEVYSEFGITATAGIGTNLYLAKVAMDIVAKHIKEDEFGVRIAKLDEKSYREKLWNHKPLTDFWRVGRGYAKKLEEHGMYTMGDIARCSLGKENEYFNENLLFKLFGINAELLIDHAWGVEPCKISDIKKYKPESNSISLGQVLKTPYTYNMAEIIICEMADQLVLDLVEKKLITDQIVINIGYDVENLNNEKILKKYSNMITKDNYGRDIIKPSHGSINLLMLTSSTTLILEAVKKLYSKTADKNLLIRRLNIVANQVVNEDLKDAVYEQISLFDEEKDFSKEKQIQHAVLDIKKKYGKNAIIKGNNLLEGATMRERNKQIGGHKA